MSETKEAIDEFDDTTSVYELLTPVTINGEEVTHITLVEPGVEVLEAWAKLRKRAAGNPVGFALKAMSDMCDYAAEDLRRLKARDFNGLQKAMSELTGNASSSDDEF